MVWTVVVHAASWMHRSLCTHRSLLCQQKNLSTATGVRWTADTFTPRRRSPPPWTPRRWPVRCLYLLKLWLFRPVIAISWIYLATLALNWRLAVQPNDMTAFRSRWTLHAKKKMARTPFMWRRSLIQCLPYMFFLLGLPGCIFHYWNAHFFSKNFCARTYHDLRSN